MYKDQIIYECLYIKTIQSYTGNAECDQKRRSSMGIPTEKEYEEAKQASQTFRDWLRMSKQKQEELLDMLVICRNDIKSYQELLDEKNEVIAKYEIYQSLQKETKGR